MRQTLTARRCLLPDMRESLTALQLESLADMHFHYIIVVYFFYGLAFFSMGLVVAIEGGRSPDPRLKRALRPLAIFGLLHGTHEWIEMFIHMEEVMGHTEPVIPEAIRLGLLAFSFLSLAAFGSYLLAKTEGAQRVVMLIPLGLEAVWVFGLAIFRGQFPAADIWTIADVWSRYTLAIPAGALAAIGLVVQQRAFRRAGLVRFGNDALWAAVAFGWYGVIGQLFTRPSALPPSDLVNSELFLVIFGFPIQLLRAGMAVIASIFIVRFLRSFQVEIDRQIATLQAARIRDAEQRESLRGELIKRVMTAQESERQRIARELHDETGQALTAIGMGLRGLSGLIRTPNSERVNQILRQLENLTAHALDELQRLIADLRPSHLDDLGLPSALRWYAHDLEGRTNLNIHVHIEGEEREVDPAIKTSLFRIVQEALTNVVKHAEASTAWANLVYTTDAIRILVKDDGQGFDPNVSNYGRISWGLKNMEERATLLGGKFEIHTGRGKGTTVEVTIPYQQQAQEIDDDYPPSAS